MDRPHEIQYGVAEVIVPAPDPAVARKSTESRKSSTRGSRKENAKPVTNAKTNEVFYNSIDFKDVGEGGSVALTGSGILIHPGSDSETVVRFRPSMDNKVIKIRGWIEPLPAEGLKDPVAGTVNVQLLVDGKILSAEKVDRGKNFYHALRPFNGRTFTVIVDNDGSFTYDWFHLGFD